MENIFDFNYDLTITNPPFGKDCEFSTDKLSDEEIKDLTKYTSSKKMPLKTPAELYFSVNAINNSKVSCLVLPEGMLNTDKYHTFRKEILHDNTINASISLSSDIFHGSTNYKTSALIFEKGRVEENYNIFMASTHDGKGNYSQEDLTVVIEHFSKGLSEGDF